MAHRGILKKSENGWMIAYETHDWTARWHFCSDRHQIPVNNKQLKLKEDTAVSFIINEDMTAEIIQENEDNTHI